MKKTTEQLLDGLTDVCKEYDANPATTPQSVITAQIEDAEKKVYDSLSQKLESIINEKMSSNSVMPIDNADGNGEILPKSQPEDNSTEPQE